MKSSSIKRGFNSSSIKPVVRTAELMPAGKHDVAIVSVEPVAPKPTDSFTREEGDYQMRVTFKNTLGQIISAFLNTLGFLRSSELKTATADMLPEDINYKALGTNSKDFGKLPLTQKWEKLCTTSPEGYAVRRDNNMRIVSKKHTEEALGFAGQCIGAAGITEDDEYDDDTLPALLKGRTLGIKVSEEEYQGDTKLKVKGFYPLGANADVSALEELVNS